MSLNFRPVHNDSSFLGQLRFRTTQIMVLLGYKPSVSSILREILLRPTAPGLEAIANQIQRTRSTAAYLIFSDGDETMVLEKDYRTALKRLRRDFIVVTNHDRADENQDPEQQKVYDHASNLIGLGTLPESTGRKLCIYTKWREAVARAVGNAEINQVADVDDEDSGVSVKKADIVDWLCIWPVSNECTHYAVVMDPKKGSVVWLKRYLEPLVESEGEYPLY